MGLKYPQRALDASYNNVASGLAANNVQEALDEVAGLTAPVMGKMNLASDTTISQAWSNVAGGNMTQFGSMQVSITTSTTCNIIVHFSASAVGTTSASELVIGYQKNSDTAVPMAYVNLNTSAASRHQINFRDLLTNQPAGSYTFKAMASRGSSNCIIKGNSNLAQAVLLVEAYPA